MFDASDNYSSYGSDESDGLSPLYDLQHRPPRPPDHGAAERHYFATAVRYQELAYPRDGSAPDPELLGQAEADCAAARRVVENAAERDYSVARARCRELENPDDGSEPDPVLVSRAQQACEVAQLRVKHVKGLWEEWGVEHPSTDPPWSLRDD